MKKLVQTSLLTLFLTLGFISGAMAMDLNSAKRAGLVGEKQNGLIEATLPNPSADLSELVNTTNAGRIEVYKQMADKQNIPLKEIQAIAAQKIYDLAEEGDFLMVNGKWVKK